MMTRDEALSALSAAPGWYKATLSQGQNGCVEVNRTVPGYVGVRDSKLGDESPVFAFAAPTWTAFLTNTRG